MERSRQLIEIARPPCSVTFHRAFDMSRDASRSLEKLIELGGVDRVLTSGLEETVTEGLETLRNLIGQAGERIIVMPGCGITERNFTRIQEALGGAKEYHVALDGTYESRMTYRPDHIYMGGLLRQTEFSLRHTDKGRVGGTVVSHKGGGR